MSRTSASQALDLTAIYSEEQVAQYLHMTRGGLRARRWRGDDTPPWFTLGKRVFYRGSDVAAWIDSQAVRAAKTRK